MLIEVRSWDKYNPKRDQKVYTWLKLSNDIGTDPDLFGYDAEQRYLWILILCQASKKNSSTLNLNESHLAHTSGVEVKKVSATLGQLNRDGFIVELEKEEKPNNIISVVYDSEIETDTTPRIDKNRIDKNRIDKNRIDKNRHETDARALISTWNHEKIIIHDESEKIIDQVSRVLKKKDRKLNEYFQAIINYSTVLKNPDSYFTHKWTLLDFMTRATSIKFYGENFVPSNFINTKAPKTAQAYHDRVMDELGYSEVSNG